MTEDQLDELLSDCPTLFHMAEEGSWGGISEVGLLSTSALLDRYNVLGEERIAIESRHRPSGVDITHDGSVVARVRDQIPMSDNGLLRALPSRLTPSMWYKLLNEKVFFWLTQDRLERLLSAKAYRNKSHDVLEVDARSLVNAHRARIWLCPINSGCTKPYPHPRDESIFQRIEDYPYAEWRKKRRSGERAVELSVDYSVPDISNHVLRVTRRTGIEIDGVLWRR